jgi:mannose-1-phosphate guanylyltransferase
MKAIILVGGEGTRLRPLTLNTPKPLLPIANVPFIERQLRWLRSHGVDEVVLSLGYLPDAFNEHFHANPVEGIHLDYVVEEEPLGTAGAIKYAARDIDGDFIVCNGDVLTELDLTSLVSFHRERNSTATIALTYVEDPSAFGVVPTKPDGQVIAFVEKPPRESAPSHWINAGTYVLAPEFLDLIPEGINVSVERETFPRLLENGSMYALESDCYWLDIGTPEKYLQAHSDYLNNIARFSSDDGLKEIAPGIFSDGDVTLGESLQIVSPVLIGSGSVIGDHCVLDASTLGHRCVIENNVRLEQSVIHSGTKIDHDSILNQSVVGRASDIGDHSTISDKTIVGAHEKIDPGTELQAVRVPAGV